MIYLCKSCRKYFSIDYGIKLNERELLVRYLEGTSLRRLANQLNSKKSTVSDKIHALLHKVPNSNHITEIVCKHYKGVLLVDAKYINIKGYAKGAAFIYCIDYYSHDILIHQLSPSENYHAYIAFFKKLKQIEYPLNTLICDGLATIHSSAKYIFPNIKIQICTNHVKEGIRRILQSRTNLAHEHFIKQIEYLFRQTSVHRYSKYATKLLKEHKTNIIYLSILIDLNKKHEFLVRYLINKSIPSTTNLIEAFNSHLEARLKSIRCFQRFETAEIFLNAWVMNRRLTPFKDCKGKFKVLNGTCSLAHTAMEDATKVSLLKKVTRY